MDKANRKWAALTLHRKCEKLTDIADVLRDIYGPASYDYAAASKDIAYAKRLENEVLSGTRDLVDVEAMTEKLLAVYAV